MTTKIHTIKDIPQALYEGNPHEGSSAAWWKWREDRTKQFARRVVISSSYPDGSPRGMELNEGSLVPDGLPMLRMEGAFWFYIDEAVAALSSSENGGNNEEIEQLRAKLSESNKRIEALEAELTEIAATARSIVDRCAKLT